MQVNRLERWLENRRNNNSVRNGIADASTIDDVEALAEVAPLRA